MPYLILLVILVVLILGPQIWVQRVMIRYHRRPEANFPGNASEFARHLLNRFGLQQVGVETTDQGDHYDPDKKCVRLTPDKFKSRSLTSIVIAAHEVGHALQHAAGDPMLAWRSRLVVLANWSQKLGSFLLFAAPLLTVATRAPSAGAVSLLAAFLILGMNLVVQLVTLPVELDASFKKALPLLKDGYLEPHQHKAANKILRAAALTYVSGALAGLLNFWRWLQMMKR